MENSISDVRKRTTVLKVGFGAWSEYWVLGSGLSIIKRGKEIGLRFYPGGIKIELA
jgi:hypothetical protein